MPSHSRYKDYHQSSSDDEVSDDDNIMLHNSNRKGGQVSSDSEEEVLGIQSDSEDESDIALSDVEEPDDGLPDPKAWGKNKKNFYSTDYVDQDYNTYQEKDARMAELEEDEAKNLQSQLAKSMDDDDFNLEFAIPQKETEAVLDEQVKSDLSKLSKRQQIELLKKESPEFLGLIEDYQNKMEIAQTFLQPIIDYYEENNLTNCEAKTFVNVFNQLILNYCVNITMYTLIKSQKTNIKSHPVIKRLYQYRKLLSEMEPHFNEIIKPQAEILLKMFKSKSEGKQLKESTLKVLSKLNKIKNKSTKKVKDVKNTEELESDLIKDEENLDADSDEMETNLETEEVEDEANEIGKRAITYQISKNKGLMPHRKKEQRNPRVKHRNKFRKAKIRRKGAVREVKTAVSRYGGEISGIKSTVSKSVKIK